MVVPQTAITSQHALLFTGHLLDAIDRTEKRFSNSSIDEAKKLIGIAIDQAVRKQINTIAISSLAAGADMLFADEILKRKIPLVIFIPIEKQLFIQTSVNYKKAGDDFSSNEWNNKFDQILSKATEVFYLDFKDQNQNAYANCNNEMLRYAIQNDRLVSAIALIKPDEDLVEGGASHFVSILKERSIPVQIIWPDVPVVELSSIKSLAQAIPVFGVLDSFASHHQSRWSRRLRISLIVLGIVAFFDAFVTVPDHFLFENGQVVRIIALLVSVAGAFLTLQLQVSDKTSLSLWTSDRAKAEQIRSEIWYYLFNFWTENNRFGPYTETEFDDYVKRVAPGSWKKKFTNVEALISLKQRVNQFTTEERINYYSLYRLNDQLGYFKKKKNHFTSRLRKYKLVTSLFLGVSIFWGSFKLLAEFNMGPAFFMDMSPSGMMISFIALVASFAEANNSKEMEYKYQQMASGLSELINRKKDVTDDQRFGEWVRECETFLRTQNNEWSLKRDTVVK